MIKFVGLSLELYIIFFPYFSPGFYIFSLQNDYLPPEWLPLLQVVIGGIGQDDEENSILFQLLSSIVEAGNENIGIHIPHVVLSLVGAISKSIPPNLEPWPQVCSTYPVRFLYFFNYYLIVTIIIAIIAVLFSKRSIIIFYLRTHHCCY